MPERDRAKGANGSPAPVPTVRHAKADKEKSKTVLRQVIKAVLGVLFFLGIYAALVSPLFVGRVHLELGAVANRNIKSPIRASYIDKEKTRLKREDEVQRKAENIYNINDQAKTDFNQEIALMYNLTIDVDSETFDAAAREALDRGYSEDVIEHVRKMTKEELDQRIRYPGLDYIRDMVEQGLRFPGSDDESAALDQAIRDRVDREGLIGPPRLVFMDIVRTVLDNNKVEDVEKEKALIRRIEAETAPVLGEIQKGEIILGEGEQVTQLVLDKIEAVGLSSAGTKILYQLIGLLLFELAFLGFAFLYLRRFHKRIMEDDITAGILGVIVLFVVVVTRLLSGVHSPITGYLISFPILTGTFLIWLLLDWDLSIKSAGGLLLFMGVGFSLPMEPLFAAFVACLVGFAALPEDWSKMDLLRAGLWASAVNMAMAAIFGLHANETPYRILWQLAYASLSGIGAGAVSLGLFIPFFESLFRITTSSKLLELSGTDVPVLRRLMIEAPGTYQHSLMVGNLAQAAAEELGADALLTRVASYYHDIGKLRRPNFFTENQAPGVNPHDELSPSLSVLIITSHIKDGIELARQHRLPEEIINVIGQHHGTTCIVPFFEKARQLSEDQSKVMEDDFRYNFPSQKPQSLEAAIVMLADCAESAIRSQEKPTPVKMAQLIDKIIQSRLADGQFDDCHLTLKEIERIKSSFLRTLESIYHSRIEYPDAEQGRKKNDGKNRQ